MHKKNLVSKPTLIFKLCTKINNPRSGSSFTQRAGDGPPNIFYPEKRAKFESFKVTRISPCILFITHYIFICADDTFMRINKSDNFEVYILHWLLSAEINIYLYTENNKRSPWANPSRFVFIQLCRIWAQLAL